MLAKLNRALLRAAPEDRFCTAVLAHLRPTRKGALGVALTSAGHPPPLLQRADGVIEAHARDGGEFGEKRLVRVLADAHGRSAAGIARRVERAVVDFRCRPRV